MTMLVNYMESHDIWKHCFLMRSYLKATIKSLEQVIQAGLAMGVELLQCHVGVGRGQLAGAGPWHAAQRVMHLLHHVPPLLLVRHMLCCQALHLQQTLPWLVPALAA